MTLPIEEFDRLVLERWPEIPWLEPIYIIVARDRSRRLRSLAPRRRGYACRLCIARNGRHGSDPLDSKEEVLVHIAQTHTAAVEVSDLKGLV